MSRGPCYTAVEQNKHSLSVPSVACGLAFILGRTELACIFAKLLSVFNVASQPGVWLEGLMSISAYQYI